jgi:MFS family permease
MTEPITTRTRARTAESNRKRFIAFRVLFNARFYYPVLAVLFLDLGLSATQYTLLNFVWAIVIVFAEVPSGVLADRVGKRPLLIAASVCMVFEMLALLVAPRNGGLVLLGLCLLNRILSGTAEAMASGADESLAYDSLAADARQSEWPDVLATVMRYQSIAMPVAMLVGATVYDAGSINRALVWSGSSLRIASSAAARLPLALTFMSALAVVWLSYGMREPEQTVSSAPEALEAPGQRARSSWGDMARAARWILASPVALFAILGGVLIDSVVRLFMTFASVFYTVIDLPVASFGVIGAASGALGLVVSPLARWLARTGSMLRNYVVLALVTFAGLVGVALKIQYWGILFTVPLLGAMMALGYLLSNTLNTLVDSSQRATVLSFKGLVFNLGYGFVSLLFALALRFVRGEGSANSAFATALGVLPLWLAFTLLVLALSFWKQRAALQAQREQRAPDA